MIDWPLIRGKRPARRRIARAVTGGGLRLRGPAGSHPGRPWRAAEAAGTAHVVVDLMGGETAL